MHAHDRFLPDWFNRINSRQITLPRFQRHEAWKPSAVSDLLTTVLRGLPLGSALILNVGDREKFVSRTMIDAPTQGGPVNEQLLDGQQRLTALWRSMKDKYPDMSYLVALREDDADDNNIIGDDLLNRWTHWNRPDVPDGNDYQDNPVVVGWARWTRDNTKYPVWVDNPNDCWRRGYIPVRLLCPGDMNDTIDTWVADAIHEGDAEVRLRLITNLKNIINSLRTKVRECNLPYLSLSANTPKEVALDVFIKMNTSSVKLSSYDIVVAYVEEATGKSLHEHVDNLNVRVPRAADYVPEVSKLVLDVVSHQQNFLPSNRGYERIDYEKMLRNWDTVISSIQGMIHFLEEECIYDEQRLPSYPALPVIAVLSPYLREQCDTAGRARILLRKYLWRAFLTNRYDQSSTTNALKDYRAIRDVLENDAAENTIPILNQDAYPIPTKEMLLLADWPKNKTIQGRGILALQIKCGAEDLADGGRATVHAITNKEHPREYHHLFPKSLLEDAGIPEEDISRALNCALITWSTNRDIANKDPLMYLEERINRGRLDRRSLSRRLKTHLIPFDKLNVGYNGLADNERREKVQIDYGEFLSARAEILARAATLACEGKTLDLSRIFPGVR